MPVGKVHNVISLGAAASGGVVVWLATGSLTGAASFAAGCTSGILLSPDLDSDAGNMSRHVAREVFGWAGRLWGVLWAPYAKLIKHRSPLSHMPILGTAGRLLYLALLLVPLYLLISNMTGLTLHANPAVRPLLPYALAGLVVSDTLHWLADKLL